MLSGTTYRLPPSAPLTGATAGGASPGWPTPTVKGNYNQAGLSAKSGDGLHTAANRWPTPTARLGDPKRGMPSQELARERMESGRRNLDDAVMTTWPTPTASDHQGPGSLGRRTPGKDALATREARARSWPTPTYHPKDGCILDAGASSRELLRERGILPPPDPDHVPGRGRPLSSTVGGRLNPEWVEILLGLPPGWTEV
jgi:hypothetical protein